ncbi:MAG TPA: hypothetical protein DCZ03_16615 [Gammaproteobacteria bacterium]|nr:hypothetical protein [Gammaproteobacteria bacterium]
MIGRKRKPDLFIALGFIVVLGVLVSTAAQRMDFLPKSKMTVSTHPLWQTHFDSSYKRLR